MGFEYGRTALLLNFEGANGSTSIADESTPAKTVTASGGAQVSTSGPAIGTGALLLNGTSAYVDVQADPYLAIDLKDFTVSFFCKTTANASGAATQPRLVAARAVTNTTGVLQVWQGNGSAGTTANVIGLANENGTGTHLTTTTVVNDGLWHHIEFGRRSGALYAFFDGALKNTSVSNPNFSRPATDGLRIGARGDLAAGSFFNGQIDGFSLTVGRCLHTTDFTPPTAPLSAQTYEIDANPLSGVVQSGDGIGAAAIPPVDTSLINALSATTVDGVLVYGFPASEASKLRDLSLFTTDGFTPTEFSKRGYGVITGTVKEKASPANLPRLCRVYLYAHPGNALARVVFSDAAGIYEFRGVDPSKKYMVIATDETGIYRAVIADNLTPTAIPQPA